MRTERAAPSPTAGEGAFFHTNFARFLQAAAAGRI